MNHSNITAILMDTQIDKSTMHVAGPNNNLTTRVFNKPLLDHHLESLQGTGIRNHLVLSEREHINTYQSTGATFKAGTTFKQSLDAGDLEGDYFLFLPGNTYLQMDLDYFIDAHLESGVEISRAMPLLTTANRSLSYMDPIIINKSVMTQLFSQVSRLTIDSLKVLLDRESEDQRVPASVITSALSTPGQVWNLHHQLYTLGLAGQTPMGFPYRDDIWAGVNANIHASVESSGLVIADDNVVIKDNVTFKGFVVIGEGVVIDKGAYIENSIIEKGTYVGKNTRIENSVVIGHNLHRIDRGVSLKINEKQILGQTNVGRNWFRRTEPTRSDQVESWNVIPAG